MHINASNFTVINGLLGRATCIVHLINSQTSQKRMKSMNISLVVTYCPIYKLCKKVRNENIMELFGNIHTHTKKSKLIMVKNMTQA